MTSKVTRVLLATASLCLLIGTVQADDIHPYSEPLPVPDYVTDIDTIIASAFERYGWSFEPQGDGATFKGNLSYKGYEVATTVTVQDRLVTIVADSAHETGCSSNCDDLRMGPHVLRWITNIRRTIALDITHRVKDHLSG